MNDMALTPEQERKVTHIKCDNCRVCMLQGKMARCHSTSYPGLAAWKPLPPDYRTAYEGYFVYGFPLSEKKAKRILKRLRCPPSIPDRLFMHAVEITRQLELGAKLKHALTYTIVKADAQSEEEGMAFDQDGKRAVDILALGCTKNRKLYHHRRPTPKQMEILEDFLGEPRWFETLQPKSEYQTFFFNDLPSAYICERYRRR
ncbi:hypothetical protein CC2G_007984 [Coprinopsis cinerea AmutBmut pab1-1]|nr:hypothetical protein CC2G_007984 [Coprinopsis cinerea AmutBmut pab1-1]